MRKQSKTKAVDFTSCSEYWLGRHDFQVGIHDNPFTECRAMAAWQAGYDEERLNEPMCKECGHSKSRHQTAGGFCKHCMCVEFVGKKEKPKPSSKKEANKV